MSEQNLAFLSFDGGGVRGLSSLYILKQIMITIARDLKLKDPPKPCEYFNLIGGTSTGGLIAIMLGRLQMDIDSCIRAYMNMSETIFKKKSSLPIDYRLRLRSRFDAKILEKCFKRIITSQGLEEDALLRDDTGDEHCKTFVCAIEQSTSKLVGFSSYSSRRDDSRLSVIKIWEAARATSAATSYFDPICINYNGIKEAFLDGGMVANNPIHELWSEGSEIYGAKSLQDNIKCVLSIGTGVPYIKPFTNSLIELPETLVRLATDADKAAETFQRLHQNLDKKDKYFRLTVPQGLETVEVEDYAQLEKIRTLTMSFLTKQDTHKKVNLCAQVLLKSQVQKNALALRDESTIQKFEGSKLSFQRLIEKISKYDHQRTHKRLVRKKLPGTTQWFLDHPSFQAWVGGSGCNTLWCSGIIGSGKTTIAASVVEYLMHQAQRTGAATIYFYCEAEQRDQCRGTDLLASFIRQLLTYMSIIHKPCPPGIQGSIQRYYGRKESVPDWDDLVDVFVGLSRCVSGATYVIDGLDEFPETDILNILRFVEAQPSGAGYQSMKILLLSRDKVAGPYLDIGRFISEVTRIATGQHNDDDIRSYITITIQHKSSQLRELTANSTLMNEVESRLFSGALGMFLWVHLQIEILWAECHTDADVRNTISNLPRTLGETYLRCFNRIDFSNPLAMKILKWVSYASRPLRVGELQEAIAFTPQDTEWTANNIPNSSGLIGHCANLIIEDMADQCVRFAHPSVKQFLESQPARFNPGQGELDCGELCIAYLSFSNFSLQIAKNTEVRYAIAPPDFAALLPASVNGLFSLATKWTSIGTLQTKPISFGFSQPSIATEEERYQFLNYAIENWAPQTKTITNGSPLWPRFLNLAMQKDSRCSLHPWGTKTVMSQKSHQHRLLSWAIKEDHLPLVKALITIESITAMRELCELPVIYGGIPALHYASQLGRCDQVELLKSYGKFERNQRTALSYAAENGHFDVVVSLFASSRKSQYWLLTPSDERTALRSRETLGYAIKNGHIQIVQFLVEQGFSLESPDKTEPFIGIAARYGHTAVVEYLISKRVFVDTENEYYKKTPLHFAAEFWHIETVDMLIRHGAAVHHKDNQGQNALMCAIFGKKEGTKLAEVRYLMEKLLSRVDIEDKDIHGRTALTQAAMGGHSRRDIVKILIEKGADIETQDNRHFTPLQWAYRSGARDEFSIRLLLENGAEPVEPDNSNITVSLDRCIAGLQVDSSGFHWVSG